MRVVSMDEQARKNPFQETFERLRARRWDMARTSARERIERLRKLRTTIIERREALYQAIHADFRKPAAEVESSEMLLVLMELDHAIKHLGRWMKPRKVGAPVLLAGTRSQVRYEPKGVVLIISPWNYPFQLTISPLVAAVAAGNCVVLKPSEKTPHSSAFMAQLVRDVFDPSEVTVVLGGAEESQALLELPFDHFFFTGGPRVGRKVMEAAAKHLAGVTLELGGKSPAVVDSTADIKATAERIAFGKFLNGGQTCVAPDYVLVPAAKEEEFLARMRETIEHFYGKTEEARKANPDFCRMVDDAQFTRVNRLLERSVASGVRVAVGGTVDAASRYIAPTVLADVKPDSPIMEEEIFGPVLPVLRYERLDEAVRHIRAGTKPLAMYIFSHDRAAVERLLEETSAGGTCVNTTVVHLSNAELPFGGIGESGVGNYHGEYGFRTFSHERAVLRQGPLFLLNTFFPPYTEKAKKMARMASRLFE
ncbi:aldehyde dehydrogenase family protein [Vitiosangium sp. GDMCC 1.1324]|uniref:aldehyde dehydrogenase family protein n=1 Tax=Vitiosangium sp. (strain GDMCC 1.1324) TaxID=2138576 RepID=UPI000D3BC287|nr:aldehyde dehydrogenase family protein [Vitiosangium sp. GDMCC 1.1324]PTL79912.1 aldehyde dehydrogenase family protein [Vitiosangium sp. GDMCC 1.1324]